MLTNGVDTCDNTVLCKSQSVEETQALGNRIGVYLKKINSPLCIALIGDLGTGKTHMSKGIGQGFGIEEEITSPTFAIMNTYKVGRKYMYHFDVYRLDDVSELENIGFSEFTEDQKSIVEWADKFPEELPDHTLWVYIQRQSDMERKIILSSNVVTQKELEELGGPLCI